MTLTPEDKAREDEELFQEEISLCIPGFCLRPLYSDELYALCEKIETDVGLANGATALYWHLQPIFQQHMRKR